LTQTNLWHLHDNNNSGSNIFAHQQFPLPAVACDVTSAVAISVTQKSQI